MNPLPWDEHWYAWRLDPEVYGSTWDSGHPFAQGDGIGLTGAFAVFA